MQADLSAFAKLRRVRRSVRVGGKVRPTHVEQPVMNGRVALKVLTSTSVKGATALREAQMAARLQHRNIATVHDVLDVDGRVHIVMEYLEGRTLDALLAYERSLALAPNANTYSNIATIHYDAGRYEEARRAYEESLRIQPKAPVTQRNLGDTLRKLGQEARARTAYEAAIALASEELSVNPSNNDAVSRQALCFAKLGNAQEAVRLADLVLADASLRATARYRAGVALILAGERQRGIDEVVRAIQDGHSRSVAERDEDLASAISDPALAAALRPPPAQ